MTEMTTKISLRINFEPVERSFCGFYQKAFEHKI